MSKTMFVLDTSSKMTIPLKSLNSFHNYLVAKQEEPSIIQAPKETLCTSEVTEYIQLTD